MNFLHSYWQISQHKSNIFNNNGGNLVLKALKLVHFFAWSKINSDEYMLSQILQKATS